MRRNILVLTFMSSGFFGLEKDIFGLLDFKRDTLEIFKTMTNITAL